MLNTAQPLAYKQALRERMLKELRAQGIIDEKVLAAMASIPRELFLPPSFHTQAYHDKALPIGENQTISMPSVVARMTQELQPEYGLKVLEIGTGSGYQAAILCKLFRRVFTIERIPALAKTAETRLNQLRLHNFTAQVSDGTAGWASQAPFDRIIVTAAGPTIPQPLVDQLAIGGVLITPVGEVGSQQQRLVKITKVSATEAETKIIGKVAFVPLVGSHGVKIA